MSSRDISFKIESGIPINPPLVLVRFTYWSWAGLVINFRVWWMYDEKPYVIAGRAGMLKKHYNYNVNFMFKGKHFFINKVYIK